MELFDSGNFLRARYLWTSFASPCFHSPTKYLSNIHSGLNGWPRSAKSVSISGTMFTMYGATLPPIRSLTPSQSLLQFPV